MSNYPFRKSRLWSREVLRAIRRDGPGTLQFWALALVIGIAAGWATLAFRIGISTLQEFHFTDADSMFACHSAAKREGTFVHPVREVFGKFEVGFVFGIEQEKDMVIAIPHVADNGGLPAVCLDVCDGVVHRFGEFGDGYANVC